MFAEVRHMCCYYNKVFVIKLSSFFDNYQRTIFFKFNANSSKNRATNTFNVIDYTNINEWRYTSSNDDTVNFS